MFVHQNKCKKIILEYIWIGGKNEIRSKTRVLDINSQTYCWPNIPDWNYDGSSTWQADSNGDTEIILKPCAFFKDPLRKFENCYLVLCETYHTDGSPTVSNHRFHAEKIFEEGVDCEPWFGLEQEYFMLGPVTEIKEGYHYCGMANNVERNIAEEHMRLCIEAGLMISGINAEVVQKQWEFQIGPCEGIHAGDHLIIARYLLDKVAEKYNIEICYHPKLYDDSNGSGCHINFSTFTSRLDNGIEQIYEYIKKLDKNHTETIKAYGDFNELRLTGIHETSSYNKFTYGIGTRNTSVRIPNSVVKEKSGYFEDRRPAANIDPYLATSTLFKICCFNEIDT
jgi:glutamine synthetase